MTTYNVYSDESCHLENDRQPIMALGASGLFTQAKKTGE